MMGVVLPQSSAKNIHGENRKPSFRGQHFLAILKYTLHAILKNEYIKKFDKIYLKNFLIGRKIKSFWANFCTRNVQTPRNKYYAYRRLAAINGGGESIKSRKCLLDSLQKTDEFLNLVLGSYGLNYKYF
jgi:hypothetical protein